MTEIKNKMRSEIADKFFGRGGWELGAILSIILQNSNFNFFLSFFY